VPGAPSVAVVIVTHDSDDVLPATLTALAPQLSEDDELVIVDSGSRADPTPLVTPLAPAARVVRRANLGFAGGAHVGADATSAPLLLFLNPDAVPQPGALHALRAAAAQHPGWGAWQALVTLPGGERVNTSGGVMHFLGIAWSGGCELPVETVRAAPGEVSFASGAALVVRREAWEEAGGFNPDYFLYGEDVDLSLRLWLAGWRVGVVPEARVEHEYEFAKGDYKWFHLERNRWWTVLAAYPASLLAMLAPALLAFDLALLAVAARDGWLGAKLRSQAAVLRSLPRALRRRRQVQATRTIGAATFSRLLTSSLDSPHLGAAAQVRALRGLQAGYWKVVRALLTLPQYGAVRRRRPR
jgi:N-acetylglucosaminyl-diphospho-decaprenol L-rhamnosyltransferase